MNQYWADQHLDYVQAVERNLGRRLEEEELARLCVLADENGFSDVDRLKDQLAQVSAILNEITEGFVTMLKSDKVVKGKCRCGYNLDQCIARQKYDKLTCCENCEHASNVE